MELFKTPKIKFMKYKYIAFVLSGIVIALGVVSYISKGGFRYGIDFSGGTLVELAFKENTTVADIRSKLSKVELGDSLIQRFGEKNEFLIKTQRIGEKEFEEEQMEDHARTAKLIIDVLRKENEKEELRQGKIDLNNSNEIQIAKIVENYLNDRNRANEVARKIVGYRNEKMGLIRSYDELYALGLDGKLVEGVKKDSFLGSFTTLGVEIVGPQIGKDLRKKAILAIIWALLGMLVYIGLRFKIQYGIAGVITLFHDALVTLAFISFFNKEISLNVVAALLTIVGFSINDTIVIFDRVRDNLKSMRKHNFEEILNTSVNQTLSRTVITSGVVFVTVVVLFLFGGEIINGFAFTMIVGVISGSYSTIYQSCTIVYLWEKLIRKKRLRERR